MGSGKNSNGSKIPHTCIQIDGEHEVWEEMSGGDTSMAGEGSMVAGTGVDVNIVPPSSVKVGNAWAA
jgi:hypothetical protein